MKANNRRKKILSIIRKSAIPVTGKELAALLQVTRQVIVQDIALLRAEGEAVFATSSGYLLVDSAFQKRPIKVFTCRHKTLEEAEKELMIIVQNGGRVRDVIIEHPIYGEITGALMIDTPAAVKNLIERLRRKDSLMLSSITDGAHMHTVDAKTAESLEMIEANLQEAGILI